MTNTNLNNRRFTIAPGRPAARVFRLPVRAPGIARPASLRLDWSRDPATGAPVACWVRDDGEAAPRYAVPRRVFRLAA